MKNGAKSRRKDIKKVRFYADVLELMIEEYPTTDRDMQHFYTMLRVLMNYRNYILSNHNPFLINVYDHPISKEILEMAMENDKDAKYFIELCHSFSKCKIPKKILEHLNNEKLYFLDKLGMLNR